MWYASVFVGLIEEDQGFVMQQPIGNRHSPSIVNNVLVKLFQNCLERWPYGG